MDGISNFVIEDYFTLNCTLKFLLYTTLSPTFVMLLFIVMNFVWRDVITWSKYQIENFLVDLQKKILKKICN